MELSELGFVAKLYLLWLAVQYFSLRDSEKMALCVSAMELEQLRSMHVHSLEESGGWETCMKKITTMS